MDVEVTQAVAARFWAKVDKQREQPMVDVDQSDREAAAALLAEHGVFTRPDCLSADNVTVQAFARHRSTAHATGFAEGVERAAEVAEAGVQDATDWDSSYWDQACENRAQAIRALKPSTDPAKEGGDE